MNSIALRDCPGRVGGLFLDALSQRPLGKDFLSVEMVPTSWTVELAPCFVSEYSNKFDECAACDCGIQPCDSLKTCSNLLTVTMEFVDLSYDTLVGNPFNPMLMESAIAAVKATLANFSIPGNAIYGVHVFKVIQLKERRAPTDAAAVVYSTNKTVIDTIKLLLSEKKFKVAFPGQANEQEGTLVASSSSSTKSSASRNLIIGIIVISVVVIVLVSLVVFLCRRRKSPNIPLGGIPSTTENFAFQNPMFPEPSSDVSNPMYATAHGRDDDGTYSEFNAKYSEPAVSGADDDDNFTFSSRDSTA